MQTPFLLRDMGHHSPGLVALAIAVATLFAGLASLWYGRLRNRIGIGSAFAKAFGMVGLGYGVVALQPGLVGVVACLSVASIGFGLARPNFTAWLNRHVPDSGRATAVAVMSSSIVLGQFCTPFLSAPLISVFGLPSAFLSSGMVLAGLGIWLWRREK